MASQNPYIIKLKSCPACNSSEIRSFYRDTEPTKPMASFDRFLFQDMQLEPQEIQYDLCHSCGLLFLNPRWNEAGLAKLYGPESLYRRASFRGRTGPLDEAAFRENSTQLDAKSANPEYVDQAILHEMNWIKKVAKFDSPKPLAVDAGAGWGRAQKAIEKSGFDYLGFESAPELVKQGQASGRKLECKSFAEIGPTVNSTADLVFTHHFLEHVDTPLNCVEVLRDWLKPGGYLFVSVPTFYFSIEKTEGVRQHWMTYPLGARKYMNWGHMSQFYHISLHNLFVQAGLEPIDHIYSERNIFIIGKKVEREKIKSQLIRPNISSIRRSVNFLSPVLTKVQPVYSGLMKAGRTSFKLIGR